MNFHEYLEDSQIRPVWSPMEVTHYIEMPIFAEDGVGDIQKVIFVAMSLNVHKVINGKVHYLFAREIDSGYVRRVIQDVTLYLHWRIVDSSNINRELDKSAEMFNSTRSKDWYILETEKLADAIFKTKPQQ